ncbi:AAA family ATPase [Winogradskyella eximia]|uniref:AAA family ATPase n=1 Tax=Winogradskyella eximia TaxID=262006 RepID=UPI00249225A6|nr:AAA family ATPase [Winogradskyella eximia]
MIPNNITKEHLQKAIEDIDKNGIRQGRHSSTYDLVYRGKHYPPKLVISIANKFVNGSELDSNDFYGGKGTPAFELLKKEGFEIIAKHDPIATLIKDYKKKIKKTELKDERYKWELLDKFKGRPNLEAVDLLEELKTIDYNNLLYAMSKAVIKHLATEKPEEVRKLFTMLFDETVDLKTRFTSFNEESLVIYRSLGETLAHHQDERTISTYLTFHNPKKYTFYKYSFYKALCELLRIKQAKKNEKYIHYLALVDQIITDYIEKDAELIALVKAYIPDYYDGSNHLLLAQDILYQMLDKNEVINYWVYSPGANASKWDEFYNEGIMGLGWDALGDLNDYPTKKAIKKKLQELENVTSTKQNDTAANYEFLKVIKPDDVIIVKKGVSELLGYGVVTSDYFYNSNREFYQKCRSVDWQLKGNWKIDFNLPLKTLTNVTKYKEDDNTNYYDKLLSIMEGNEIKDTSESTQKGASFNQILYGPPGTGKTYFLKEQLFEKYTIKETSISHEKFFEETVSDLTWWHVIALALLEIGTARVNAILENRWVSKKASLSESKNVRATLWGTLQMHTVIESKNVAYTQRQAPFIFDKNEDKSWSLLEAELKEQVPELYDILDKVNNFKTNPDKVIKNYSFVTFHQSFAYEDFIEGIKPVLPENEAEEAKDLGYIVEDGVFKLLCAKAKNDPDNRYAIFIDEINRGNVSAIFGELITLIELDKRQGAKNALSIKLPYSKKEFSVPSNLDIYGTMNTADRSVEALDTALRRRFEFKEMMPDYTVIAKEDVDGILLSEVLKKINERIALLIDRDHTIGHSYFVNVNTAQKLADAFNNKIVPLLQEYFYGDYGKIGLVLGKGFVEKIKNDKIEFASFDYENANDFKTPTYVLKPVGSASIIEAIELLLGEAEVKGAK